MNFRRLLPAALGLLVALGGLGALTTPATAASGHVTALTSAGRPHGPALLPRADTRLLPHATHGAAALRALGTDLGTAAARNGMSAARVSSLLRTDPTAWVDRTGRVFFKEAPVPASAISAGTTAGSTSGAAQPAAATVADVFALHSRPTSTHIIYLNFVGMYVGGTAWNSSTLPAATYPGFSLDSDYGTFSSTEQADIQEIWERVAAAYAPFDVDVTTQAPASSSAFTRSSSSDTTYGTQVLISSSSSTANAVCGGQCAGVAYVGTFGTDSTGQYSPAWVFPSGAGGSITYVAQSAEHEAGHTFGLVHDGVVVNGSFDPYYGGNGLWGPIMGGGQALAIYQFSDGEYPGAKIESTTATYQDDLAVIAQSAPLLPDDAGDSPATAVDLGDRTSYAQSGMIGTRSDVDVFRIDRTCTGTLSVTANPTVQNSPLDLKLSVLDSSGAVVTSADPASYASGTSAEPIAMGMGASVSPSLGAGTYYLAVDGVGNPSTTQGYADYGSIGAYQITASGCPATTSTTTGGTATTGGTTGGTGTGTTGGTTGGTGTGTTTGSTSGTGTTTGSTGPSTPFTPAAPPLTVTVDRRHRSVRTSWWNPDSPPAGTSLLAWHLSLHNATTGATLTRTLAASTLTQTFSKVGTGTWVVTLRSEYSDGSGATTSRTTAMLAPLRASSPQSVHGHRGNRGGRITARATWWAPASAGSYPVTGYQVEVMHLSADGSHVLSTAVLGYRFASGARAATLAVSRSGEYRFRVRALTAAGPSRWSVPSSAVQGR